MDSEVAPRTMSITLINNTDFKISTQKVVQNGVTWDPQWDTIKAHARFTSQVTFEHAPFTSTLMFFIHNGVTAPNQFQLVSIGQVSQPAPDEMPAKIEVWNINVPGVSDDPIDVPWKSHQESQIVITAQNANSFTIKTY